MKRTLSSRTVVGLLATLLTTFAFISHAAPPTDAALQPWESPKIRPVTPVSDRHVIHSYFNTSPESPDGKYVLYYTSGTREGESGDLRVLERATGKETVVARDLVTEDAHRAACQQWSNGGKTVVYHDYKKGRWRVVAIDLTTRREKVLAEDRQLAFGSPSGPWVPIYSCHWNPGPNRDLQLVHVVTGETRTAVKVQDVVKQSGDWIKARFGTTDVSIFFPVMSPDGKKVFFKIAQPSGGKDFRSKLASRRDGLFVYDLEQGRFLRMREQWGHPSWSPDGATIFEYGNIAIDLRTGDSKRHAPSCISNHPSIAPDGRVFVTDADVSKRPFGKPDHWAVAVGSMTKDEFVVLDVFDNTKGATSWRHNHPHPAFSADGKRVYYNVNDGPWTRLKVAEAK